MENKKINNINKIDETYDFVCILYGKVKKIAENKKWLLINNPKKTTTLLIISNPLKPNLINELEEYEEKDTTLVFKCSLRRRKKDNGIDEYWENVFYLNEFRKL